MIEIGCCASFNEYELVADAGFEFIELKGIEITDWDSKTYSEARRRIQEGPIPCKAINGYCDARTPLLGPLFDRQKAKEHAQQLCERARGLGAALIGVGAPFARNIPNGFSRDLAVEQFITSIQDAADVASAYDITIMVEPLSKPMCNFITSTEEAKRFVESINLTDVTLMFDFYHSLRMDEDLTILPPLLNGISHVHVARSYSDERTYLDDEETSNYHVWRSVLHEISYQKLISLEISHTHRLDSARHNYRLLRALFD